MVSKYSS